MYLSIYYHLKRKKKNAISQLHVEGDEWGCFKNDKRIRVYLKQIQKSLSL